MNDLERTKELFKEAQGQFQQAKTDRDKLAVLFAALSKRNRINPIPNADDSLFLGVCVKHDGAYVDHTFIANIRILSKEGLSPILENPFSLSNLKTYVRLEDAIEHKLEEGKYVLFRVSPGAFNKPNEVFTAKIQCTGKEKADFKISDPQVISILEVFFSDPSLKDIYDVSFRLAKAKGEKLKIDEQITKENDNLKIVQREKKNIEQERDNLLKEIDQKRKVFSSLLRVLPPKTNDSLPSECVAELMLEETINQLRYDYGTDKKADKSKKELKRIVTSFLMALNTTQIITLHGKPGTGKTTFVNRIAAALGAKLTMISVQNNWTDASDLMGYYNPIEKTYQSTPFLDAILDAWNDFAQSQKDEKPSRLHIICLDEMNLARIEYYFATFLSLLQLEEEKRIIKLLPKDVEDKVSAKDAEYKELAKYKSFSLPANIRFVGTLNFDESATLPSPKVVDRSYYICFDELKPCKLEKVEPKEYVPFTHFDEPEDTDYVPEGNHNARHNKYVQQMHSLFTKLKGDENEFSALINQGRPSYKELRQSWEGQMFGEEG